MLDKNLPWLDWLRFLAAFCVVIGHVRAFVLVDFSALATGDKNILSAAFFAATRLGYEAVIVFFVLSGYLVGGRAVLRAQAGKFQVADYAVDRSTRILVPLVPAVILTYAIQSWVGSPDAISVVLGNIFGLQGIITPILSINGVLWTLSYEIWFYILCGAVIYITLDGKSTYVILLCVVSFLVFTILDPTLLFCWVFGALAYIWNPARWTLGTLILGLILAVTGVFFRQFGSPGSMHSSWLIQPPIELSTALFAAGISLLVAQATRFPVPVSRAGEWVYRQGAMLATFSYTLYLVHYPIIALLMHNRAPARELNPDVFAVMGGLTLLCLMASYLFFQLFENNTHLIRKKVKAYL